MPEPGNTSEAAGRVDIHLLDSALGRPMQSWQFNGKPIVSIGRADERDVQISDPYVSRLHAELRYAEGMWTLVSLGRSGVLVHGHPIDEFVVRNETVFRLGSDGPTLRFNPASLATDSRMTMFFEATVPENLFDLDQSKVEQEVGDIAQADYFQQLQKRAKEMRQGRDS